MEALCPRSLDQTELLDRVAFFDQFVQGGGNTSLGKVVMLDAFCDLPVPLAVGQNGVTKDTAFGTALFAM